MKTFLRIALIGAVVAAWTMTVPGQQAATGGQSGADALRSQLSAVQAKEAELQARERQLDEDLRPENIERSLAGVGTTRPEELREQRRRQLESEKASVRTQLDQLAQSRTRLEAAISTADAEAYRRSALVNETPSQPQPATATQPATVPRATARASNRATTPRKQRRAQRRRRARQR